MFLVVAAPGRSAQPENAPDSNADGRSLRVQRRQLDEVFNRELAKIAQAHANCSQEVKRWIDETKIQNDPSRVYVVVSRLEDPVTRGEQDKKCVSAIWTLRRQYAEKLFELARRYVEQEQAAAAFRLLHEVSLHDPDHATAARLTRHAVHAVDAVRAKRGTTAQSDWGWNGGAYQIVNSAQYTVFSNADREQAIRLCRNLERLNTAWRQVFFEYWSNEKQMRRSMSRKSPIPMARRKHRIVLFAKREEYVRVIERVEPRARLTTGYYDANRQTAFFFVHPDWEASSTWKHEATHQMFSELKRARHDLGQLANFWVVEGLALYLESLQLRNGYSFVGGVEANRLQFARYRRLCEEFYLPIEQLCRMSKSDLQRHPQIRRIYSQSAGVTQYLIQNRRDQFMQFVEAVYAGRDTAETLASLTNVRFQDLDEEYREFLTVDDDALRELDSRAVIANLAVGCTRVTDKGLSKVDLSQVRWLDLTGLPITDQGTIGLANANRLRQLSLHGTLVGDATIARLAKATELEELDVSATKITDRSVPILLRLPKLSHLSIDGTNLSPSAIQQLKRKFEL